MIPTSRGVDEATSPKARSLAGIDGLLALFQADVFRGRYAWALLLVFLLSLCAARTYFGGPIPLDKYGPDAFILLDGGWRVFNGQIPHVDFHTAIGPAVYLLVAFCLAVFSPDAAALSYSQAVAGACFALWALRLASRRLPPVAAILFCTFAVLLTIAPYELGESPLAIAPSFTYNRYSYVLLALILVESLCGPNLAGDHRREEWVGGVSTGCALALLFFLKVSFFAAAVIMIGALLICRPQHKKRWQGAACAFAAIAAVALFYLGGNIGAVWNDFRMAAAGKTVPLRTAAIIGLQNLGALVSLLVLAFFTSLLLPAAPGSRRALTLIWSALVVCGVSYLVILGNHQEAGMPLVVTAAIILAGRVSAMHPGPADRAGILFRGLLLCWSGSIFIPAIAGDAAALGYAVTTSAVRDHSSVMKFESDGLKPLLFTGPPHHRDFGPSYVACVNEGLEMLRSLPADGAIVTLANTDPFSFALGRVPARGGITWIADGNNVSDRVKPREDTFFREASTVLASRYVTDGGAVRLYSAYVNRNFRIARESPCWTLYRRK